MRQLTLIKPVRSLSEVEVPAITKCANCKTPAILYQQKTCKTCLVTEFKRLRPMIDMTRNITISRNGAVA